MHEEEFPSEYSPSPHRVQLVIPEYGPFVPAGQGSQVLAPILLKKSPLSLHTILICISTQSAI